MKRPMEFFELFLNEEVLSDIVNYTNQKAEGLIENSVKLDIMMTIGKVIVHIVPTEALEERE